MEGHPVVRENTIRRMRLWAVLHNQHIDIVASQLFYECIEFLDCPLLYGFTAFFGRFLKRVIPGSLCIVAEPCRPDHQYGHGSLHKGILMQWKPPLARESSADGINTNVSVKSPALTLPDSRSASRLATWTTSNPIDRNASVVLSFRS